MNKKKRKLSVIRFIGTLILAILFFVPFALVIYNSVKPQKQIMTDILGWPIELRLENYRNAWVELGLQNAMRNSVVVTFASLLLILLLSSMVAYWFVRHPSKISRIIEKILISSLLIPFASVMLPLAKTMGNLGLNKSLFGGILTYTGMGISFASFILSGAVRTLPLEVEEAAMIDGCNIFQVFFKIVIPMLIPSLLSVFILDLFWIWNDYIVALVMLNIPQLNTVPLVISKLFGLYANKWDLSLPAIVMSIIPILVINISMQKRIVVGMTAGAVKG